MQPLRIALLGSPIVERDGVRVSFDTRKATALLAYLAMIGHPHSRDTLAALLWPDQEPVSARGALRRTLSVLKSATGGDLLIVERGSVAIGGPDLMDLDVTAFRELARRQHEHPAQLSCADCIPELAAAAELYRDDFLAGFALRDSPEFDEWTAFTADGLRQQLAGVLERLVRARVRAGQFELAIETARRWLALDPLHEPAHAMLMRLYAWTGQRGAAVHQYRECVRILSKELGVAPLSQTTALDEAVRAGRLGRPHPTEKTSAPRPPTIPAVPPPSPLVGRAGEVALFASVCAEAGDSGRLVVLSGETGIGKTRLLADVISSTAGSGAVTVRCHEGEAGLAFGVAAEVLRAALRFGPGSFASLPVATQVEVGRLLPEQATALPPAPALNSPGAQSRFRTALGTAVTTARRAGRSVGLPLLAVEDVQWADESSADVLAFLVRRLRELPILLVLTWRPESLPRGWPLPIAAAAAVADGLATHLDLPRLDEPAVGALAAAVLPEPLTVAALQTLWQETRGLPLFVTEYLEAFRRDGQLSGGLEWRLPGGVRDLLQARLGALGETTLQVLAAGAVLNSEMTPALIRVASGRGEEEVVSALEEAVRRGVIVEAARNGGTYEFSHDALRRVVYDRTTLARRRLLHSRAADALVARGNGGAATVAAHLRSAGRDAESGEWSLRAAEQARSLYAHGQALEHLTAAAALGQDGPPVQLAIGDALTALGRYRAAILAYEQAAATCPANDGRALATFEHRLAEVHHRMGSWDVSESHLSAALELLDDGGDPALSARVLADMALVAHRRGAEVTASDKHRGAADGRGGYRRPLAARRAARLVARAVRGTAW